ncbi:uncharacterized protein M421DRAFT_418288 [Didymella exigua CBS 183.55]|uniref:Uncharacterized protein n=1 Tax=Didymella exigua CBS 183.55 TaxID=1150837 RepID=A0A6A5RSP6_9PLEO|nr:uncharacterized protein M421DRAFT_418288 [Didymella exigua CBS 183.55]KAF1930812.1 hypothetical protein M421DRAFT_418288 [Didymella exigua CBS 183.55]
MPTDAHDAVLDDIGSIVHTTHHTASAVAAKLFTPLPCSVDSVHQPIVSNALHTHAPTTYYRLPAKRGWRSSALHATMPLHCYSRLFAVVSLTLHSICSTSLPTSRGATSLQCPC